MDILLVNLSWSRLQKQIVYTTVGRADKTFRELNVSNFTLSLNSFPSKETVCLV